MSNVDIIADLNKPIFTATANALALKAPLSSPTFTGTVSGIDETMVGLGDVDNTADINKPVATATANALALKAPLSSPTFTGTVSGIDETMVGLSSVDNTADLSKPISTATANALALKAPLSSPTLTGVVSGITTDVVGLSNVDNTTDLNKPVSTATTNALALKAPLSSPTFTGTVSGITKDMVGLSNVDNTSDLNKPISTASVTALALKHDKLTIGNLVGGIPLLSGKTAVRGVIGSSPITITNNGSEGFMIGFDSTNYHLKAAIDSSLSQLAPISNPTLTGTVSGITKAMVALSLVENATISSATQTALDTKANQTTTYTKTEVDTKLINHAVVWSAGLVGDAHVLQTGDTEHREHTPQNLVALKIVGTGLPSTTGRVYCGHGLTVTNVISATTTFFSTNGQWGGL